LKAAAALEECADRCEKVARQIKQRVAGEPILGSARVTVRPRWPDRRGRPDQPSQAALRPGRDPAWKAIRVGRSGLNGGSWPTTSTPSPSGPG